MPNIELSTIVDDSTIQLDGSTLKVKDSGITSAKIFDTTIATGDLADGAVTNAKAADMAQATIKGRAAAAGTGDPTDLTADQASTILDSATDPFLRTSASGGGDVDGPASSTDNAFARFDGATGKLLQNSTNATLDDSGRALVKTLRIPLSDAGNSGAAKTIDWNDSNEQLLTLTDNVTLTLSNPGDGGRYVLVLLQDGTGGRTVTWPAAVKWPAGSTPTITATASRYDLVTLIYLSGAGIYLASINQNYSA